MNEAKDNLQQEFLVPAASNLSVPETTVLTPTRTLHGMLQKAFEEHDKSCVFSKEKLLVDCVPLKLAQSVALIGPVIGSSGAAAACEPVIRSGCRRLFLIGTAGGIFKPDIGDIIFPQSAISEEGTSKLYGAAPEFDLPTSSLQQKLEEECKKLFSDPQASAAIHSGAVWTTDAPYRESREKVQHYSEQGALAVEMEFAAIAQLCAVYTIPFAAAFVISDVLSDTWSPGFSSKKTKRSLKTLCKAVVQTIWDR